MTDQDQPTTVDEQDLLDIQYKRRTVYEAILQGDIKEIDPQLLSVALRAMADIDRTIKNKQSANQASSDSEIAAENNTLLAGLLLQHKTLVGEPVVRELVELPDITLDLVPGEAS